MFPNSFQNQGESRFNRVVKTWNSLTGPVAAITDISEQRKAQLLSNLTLILSMLFVIVLLYGNSDFTEFFLLTSITVISYGLSRTKYYKIGSYLFTYGFTLLAYLRILQGNAVSIDTVIVTTVHISLIFSSALLSNRGYAGLVIFTTAATLTAPLYSNIPNDTVNIARTAGVVFSIGAILFGIMVFREKLELERNRELADTNQELKSSKIELENKIIERTRELQDFNLKVQGQLKRFENINSISQEIITNTALPISDLLSKISREISEKLGYYHVGIFLLNEKREYAVLQAANSIGGQKMLANRHQLKVGGTGVVGYVSQSGKPRIALDTGVDAIYFNNPYLLETRSEISLPIKYGNMVIGVLDVQSTQSGAFNEEDASLLMMIANQLGIVLYTRNETSMRIDPIQKRKSGRFVQTSKQLGYSFRPDGSIVANTSPEYLPVLEKIIASGDAMVVARSNMGSKPMLAVPVKFRDQVIGVIYIEAGESNRYWTEDETSLVQSISDRVALALENARLFEDATRRAEQEETISLVTTKIGSSTDFERIMQTTIQELGLALGASRSFIQIGSLSAPDEKAAK